MITTPQKLCAVLVCILTFTKSPQWQIQEVVAFVSTTVRGLVNRVPVYWPFPFERRYTPVEPEAEPQIFTHSRPMTRANHGIEEARTRLKEVGEIIESMQTQVIALSSIVQQVDHSAAQTILGILRRDEDEVCKINCYLTNHGWNRRLDARILCLEAEVYKIRSELETYTPILNAAQELAEVESLYSSIVRRAGDLPPRSPSNELDDELDYAKECLAWCRKFMPMLCTNQADRWYTDLEETREMLTAIQNNLHLLHNLGAIAEPEGEPV